MRFLKDGPAIPDDLLIARDEGRVVFFCGAGVSMARAHLPDFFGLANDVIRGLGVPQDHAACKVLNEVKQSSQRTGVSGLISADRVFGLLERDFLVRDIQAKVAEALRSADEVDLSAHRILLDLATTPEGRVHLVTTNFDRLFEGSCNTLETWQPPRLPDLSISDEINGIVYLHGRINQTDTGADGGGLILSSADFGRAYLSDGWATQFIRTIIERYSVVFVGYAADDPPVQYLLEGLNKDVGSLGNVWAFQSGATSEAVAMWRHRGVNPILYVATDGHGALWDTLEAWAERARNPDVWYKSVIDLAKQGPEQLQSHERGQVAHIISTVGGVRKFSQGDNPPPAEWLCVFDPFRRYAKPGDVGGYRDEKTFIDPFSLYGLDSDVVPKQIDPDDHFAEREIPSTAWSGFTANRLDRKNPEHDCLATINGHGTSNIPRLTSRLAQIGVWIAKIADQPTAIWWAAKQRGLHPSIRSWILSQLRRSQKDNLTTIDQAWQYLFEAWENADRSFHRDLYELKETVKRNGWSRAIVRQYVTVYTPHLKASGGFWSGPAPPKWKGDLDLHDLLEVRIEYPTFRDYVDIPDAWLACAASELRKNLEYAVYLESELGGYGLRNISPIIEDDTLDGDCYGRLRGLSGLVIFFSKLFERLVGSDAAAAQREFYAWPAEGDTVFCRLRIWAAGMSNIVPIGAFGKIMTQMSEDAFWDSYHQRDLLLVLAKRWSQLGERTRKRIERRLLKGRPKWEGEDDAEYKERRSWLILSRLQWLANNGCEFTFDLEAEINTLQQYALGWKQEYGAKAAESMEGRTGGVRTETEHSALLNEPIHNILAKAQEMSGRTGDFVESDPYAGLCEERPLRAFGALTNAAKHNEYPAWAWRTFLNSRGRQTDKPRFSMLIAERISSYPDEALDELIGPVSYWLLDASSNLMSSYSQSFDRLVTKLVKTLRSQGARGKSSMTRGRREPDWVTDALNVPVGKIAQALFNDPRIKDMKEESAFPDTWLSHAESLLSLPDDLHRHALVFFAHQLNWFYRVNQDWTEANILCVLDTGDETDQIAIWSGFFWGGRLPNQGLYLRIKPNLLALAKQTAPLSRKYAEVLAIIILAGWGSTREETTGDRFISNVEMRDVLVHADDEFRSHIIWKIKEWSKDDKPEVKRRWLPMLTQFFADVWPRQKSVRTPIMSARISNVILSDAKYFPEVADIVIPLLTPIDQDALMLSDLQKEDSPVIASYPERVLTILHAVLSDNVAVWPFGIETVLQRIGEAKESLKLDSRLIELNRKWNSR